MTLTGRLARALAGALTLLAVTAGPALADAGAGGAVSPADGSVLPAAPRTVDIHLERPAQGMPELTLERADGVRIAFSGQPPAVDGQSVSAGLPALEPGTYVLRWRYDSDAGPRVGASAFSVGKATAAVANTGERSAAGVGVLAAVPLLVGVACVAAGVLSRRRRSPALTCAALLGLAGLAAALAAGSPVAAVLAASGALLSLLGWSLGRRTLTWVGGGVGAAASGILLAAGAQLGPLAAVCGVLGAVGLAWLGGSAAAVAASPGRARARMRTMWVVPATGALLAGGLWAAAALARTAELSSLAADTVLLASFGAALVGLVAAAGAAVSLVGRRAGAARALACVALACGAAAVLVLTPGQAQATVSPLRADRQATAAECLTGNRLQATVCLQDLYGAKARTAGVTPTLEELRAELSTLPQLRYYCHETSHAVGRASFAINGTVEDAFVDGFDVCDYGYYHGIVEGAAGSMSDSEFAAAMPALCRELATASEVFFMQCNHGLGHAAARRSNNDMLRGLEFCDALAQDRRYTPQELESALNACGTGVTMEWFATAGTGGASGTSGLVSPEVADLRDVCTLVPERWRGSCVEYVGNTLDTSQPAESLAEIGRWCLEDSGAADSCYRGVARAAAGVGLPPADVIAVCDQAAGSRSACLEYYLISYATTIAYSAQGVDDVCTLLPAEDAAGPGSVCDRVRTVVREVLSAGDGKAQTGRGTGAGE